MAFEESDRQDNGGCHCHCHGSVVVVVFAKIVKVILVVLEVMVST